MPKHNSHMWDMFTQMWACCCELQRNSSVTTSLYLCLLEAPQASRVRSCIIISHTNVNIHVHTFVSCSTASAHAFFRLHWAEASPSTRLPTISEAYSRTAPASLLTPSSHTCRGGRGEVHTGLTQSPRRTSVSPPPRCSHRPSSHTCRGKGGGSDSWSHASPFYC